MATADPSLSVLASCLLLSVPALALGAALTGDAGPAEGPAGHPAGHPAVRRRRTGSRRRQVLDLLAAIAVAANDRLQLADLLGRALAHIVEGLGMEGAAVFLRDGATGSLKVAARRGGPEGPDAALAAAAAGDAVARGEVVVTAGPAGALASIPIRGGGEIRGVLQVVSRAAPLGPEDVALLRAVADQLGLAAENARLTEEWEQTFDSITDPICVQDRAFRVLRANRALAAWRRTDPTALIGRTCGEVLHGLPPDSPCPHAAVVEEGRVVTEEVTDPVLRIPALLTTSPLVDARGDVIGSVHMARDLTGPRGLQERLLQTEKLAAVGELASGVMHEMLNPLHVISGRLQLLFQKPDLPPEVERTLHIVMRHVNRLVALADNLLGFTRRRSPRKAPLALNEVLEEVVGTCQEGLTGQGVRLAWDLDPALPLIPGDRDQLGQVFTNLIGNARDAMPSGGTVRISTRRVDAHGSQLVDPSIGQLGRTEDLKEADNLASRRLDLSTNRLPAGGWVEVRIADTGCGIAEEDLPKLFQPFFTTKGEGRGTGLGLSVSYGIVRSHGGRIRAESPGPNQGATLVIHLPCG